MHVMQISWNVAYRGNFIDFSIIEIHYINLKWLLNEITTRELKPKFYLKIPDTLYIQDFHLKNSVQTNSPSLQNLSFSNVSLFFFSLSLSWPRPHQPFPAAVNHLLSLNFQPPQEPSTTVARSSSFSLIRLHLVHHHQPVVLACNAYTKFTLRPTDISRSNSG